MHRHCGTVDIHLPMEERSETRCLEVCISYFASRIQNECMRHNKLDTSEKFDYKTVADRLWTADWQHQPNFCGLWQILCVRMFSYCIVLKYSLVKIHQLLALLLNTSHVCFLSCRELYIYMFIVQMHISTTPIDYVVPNLNRNENILSNHTTHQMSYKEIL